MCGRYVLRTATPEIAAILGAEPPAEEFKPRYNIAYGAGTRFTQMARVTATTWIPLEYSAVLGQRHQDWCQHGQRARRNHRDKAGARAA